MSKIDWKRDFQKIVPHNRYVQDGITYDNAGNPLPGQEDAIRRAFGAPEEAPPAEAAPKPKKSAKRQPKAPKAPEPATEASDGDVQL